MSVTINTQAMKTRETPSDQWQPVMIMTEAEVNAVVQDTTPTGSETVWFDTSEQSEVTVPTMTDLDEVKDSFTIHEENYQITTNVSGEAKLTGLIPAGAIPLYAFDSSGYCNTILKASGNWWIKLWSSSGATYRVLSSQANYPITVGYVIQK